MRIREVHIYQKDLILNQPYSMAGVVLNSLDSTIVKLVTDSGLVGWGGALSLSAAVLDMPASIP